MGYEYLLKLARKVVAGMTQPPIYPQHTFSIVHYRPEEAMMEVLYYLVNQVWAHCMDSDPENKFYAYHYDSYRDHVVCEVAIREKDRLLHPLLDNIERIWIVLDFTPRKGN